jgi:glutamate-1-semialdehyde 2,1-aminomutase
MNRQRSDALFARACRLMPGGVNSPVRAFRSVGGAPVYFARAAGSEVWDVDGNRFVDLCMSWGPLVLGHAHPAVVEAVRRAACDGLSFGACCPAEPELAERVLAAFPGMERVRFMSSGTEAVMTALRLARGATGRSRILKFEGGYHGHSDSLLVKAGSGLATFGTSSSLGVTAAVAEQTVVCPLDDEAALEAVFARFGSELAAAVVEPLPGNEGLLEQRPEWLRALRRLCSEHGALLIFDEVISGFRLRYGGYGDLVGVPADLVTLGKVIGGGMPVGAVAGPRAIMELLAPLGGVYQAGTLSGNPVSLAAGITTLDLLSDGAVYQRMEALGRVFDAALAEPAAERPWLRWRRIGSLLWLHLCDAPVPRRADAIDPGAVARMNALHAPMLERGFYLPPSAYELLFLSAAHDEAQVRALAGALSDLLA